MAEKLLCGHCGNVLAVPKSVERDGKEAMACFVAESTEDCQSAEELACRLDDQTFWRWSAKFCERREALLEDGEFEEADHDGENGPEDSVSSQLYEQTQWTHHFPQWVQLRISEILKRNHDVMINELKLKSGSAAPAAADPRLPAPRFLQLSPAAEKVLRFVASMLILAVVIKALQTYSII